MKYYNEVITLNKAKCRMCGDELISEHRHDFKRCFCGGIAVDGGKAYIKRSAAKLSDIIEMSQSYQEERAKYEWE